RHLRPQGLRHGSEIAPMSGMLRSRNGSPAARSATIPMIAAPRARFVRLLRDEPEVGAEIHYRSEDGEETKVFFRDQESLRAQIAELRRRGADVVEEETALNAMIAAENERGRN
ncbi:MAG TPA: hypothetical protein VKH46_12650, partial [Thermoanaerobaculia bacterium]|nr:hypothetical protein [Thermoanaerobaculia bacterium]